MEERLSLDQVHVRELPRERLSQTQVFKFPWKNTNVREHPKNAHPRVGYLALQWRSVYLRARYLGPPRKDYLAWQVLEPPTEECLPWSQYLNTEWMKTCLRARHLNYWRKNTHLGRLTLQSPQVDAHSRLRRVRNVSSIKTGPLWQGWKAWEAGLRCSAQPWLTSC